MVEKARLSELLRAEGISVSEVFGSGQKSVTTAGTRVQLSSVSYLIHSITIKAKSGNTGSIYVGASDVISTNGFILAAGEGISLDVDNLNDIWLDSSVNGEGVSYFFVK